MLKLKIKKRLLAKNYSVIIIKLEKIITAELARSLVEEECHHLNSIIDNSYRNQLKSFRFDKYKNMKNDLNEPFI
jgi:hypothetical protein